MSKNGTQTQIPATPKLREPSFDEQMTWRARWFLIRLLPLLYGASLLSGIIGYWITKDAHYLILASPTLSAYPVIRYLIPMDVRRYQLELRKIEMKAQVEPSKPKEKPGKI